MRSNNDIFDVIHNTFLGFITTNMHSIFFEVFENKIVLIILFRTKLTDLEKMLLNNEIIKDIQYEFKDYKVALKTIINVQDLGRFKESYSSILENCIPIYISYDYRKYDME